MAKKCWKMIDKISNATALCSIPNSNASECIISTKDGKVIFLNIGKLV